MRLPLNSGGPGSRVSLFHLLETGVECAAVTRAVQETLFNTPYDKQKAGLVDALMKGGAKKKDGVLLTKKHATIFIEACQRLGREDFQELMKELFSTH